MSPGQLLSLLLAAQLDPNLSIIDRARAAHHIESIYDPPERLEPGLLDGRLLTVAGRDVLQVSLPFPTAMVFPYAVADVLRRARVQGFSCTGVRCEVVEGGWRVTWDGDGWQVLSRLSTLPLAKQNRDELEAAAKACGLEVVPEAAASLLVQIPVTEYLEVPAESEVTDHEKLWEKYCKDSDRARAQHEDYNAFREIDDALFEKFLEADAALIRSRFYSMKADDASQSGT